MTDDINKSDAPEQESRRQASANFIVKQDDNSSIELRDAMDTAHRSLAESLQLSFRALQIVMLVLLVLYLVSGFRTVEDSQTGVATIFGSIVGDEGLAPGLQTNWPAPIGGFEVFNAQNRDADVGYLFKPQIDARLSQDQRITRASSRDGLRPGVDGSLLTSNGDLAHIGLAAEWEIVDPLQYAHTIVDSEGSDYVQLALETAAVHVVGQITLQELLDKPLEELRSLIQLESQSMLNELQCGIRISDIIVPSEPEPPLYIQQSYAAFDSARINAETSVEKATAGAHEMLIQAAGSNYEALLELITLYEEATLNGDEAGAEKQLALITEQLNSDEISGDVTNTISMAEGYRAQIETTLGQDYRRFESLLPTYREHPELVIKDKWLDMYAHVLSVADVEPILVPEFIASVKIGITGLEDIAQLRHRNQLNRKEAATMIEDVDLLNPWILKARDINIDGPSRQLNITDGVVHGRQE